MAHLKKKIFCSISHIFVSEIWKLKMNFVNYASQSILDIKYIFWDWVSDPFENVFKLSKLSSIWLVEFDVQCILQTVNPVHRE